MLARRQLISAATALREKGTPPPGTDPATQKSYDVEVSDALGTVRLWRSVKRADEPLPINAMYLVTGERKLIGSSYGSARPLD